MTDNEALFTYRMQQAEETLREAEKMIQGGFSGRSIINRTYYALYYALLALYIRTNIEMKTSEHTGVITIFDREFVKSGKFPKEYSVILHDIFDARQEGDYKELFEISADRTAHYWNAAKKFLTEIRNHLGR